MNDGGVRAEGGPLRIEKAVYGGDGLARTPAGEVVFVPFALPGELVQPAADDAGNLRIVEASPARVEPRCVHFGTCGGCQYQMADYPVQLMMKAAILRETLDRAECPALPEVRMVPSPDPWGYRNRIRLRVREVERAIRLGYSVRGTHEFLPVRMCPIAASALWGTAEALMQATESNRDAAEWMRAAAEVEIACDADGSAVQVHLLCARPVPTRKGSLEAFGQGLQRAGAEVRSVGASRLHAASGRASERLASWGADGFAYRVGEQTFWLRPGSFFQVNRFLLPQLVEIVCADRTGALAWDLYAGVGLFARALAQHFAAVTAVEPSPVALEELRRGLRRPADTVVGETTLSFLRKAVTQRDRPALVVLDPPRAGAGVEACELLLRVAPAQIVYVSCDPTTLARDLKVLAAKYRVADLYMLDLFPQTYHLETVMVLHRADVEG